MITTHHQSAPVCFTYTYGKWRNIRPTCRALFDWLGSFWLELVITNMSRVEVVPANRKGGFVLLCDDFRYVRNKTGRDNLTWRCSEVGCGAYAHTNSLMLQTRIRLSSVSWHLYLRHSAIWYKRKFSNRRQIMQSFAAISGLCELPVAGVRPFAWWRSRGGAANCVGGQLHARANCF